MSIIPTQHWTFKLKGGRKYHLASVDDAGRPMTSTICGRTYSPDEREDASKGIESFPHLWAEGVLCVECGTQIADTVGKLRELFLSAGQSDEDATGLADSILKLKRK